MLEKPDIQDEVISAHLRDEFGIELHRLEFLPLGADISTAVYRAEGTGDQLYFIKLRRGVFEEVSAALPKWLSEQGVRQIIPPIETKTGGLWTRLGDFTVILYPFVEGRDGYEVALTEQQWVEFGAAVKQIHASVPPPSLSQLIPVETYPDLGREGVRRYLAQVAHDRFADPAAAELAAFLREKQAVVLDLVERAGRLARALKASSIPTVVCHSDLHAGNILIGDNGQLYLVDWDNPILAPKERDLMYPGGGQGFIGYTGQDEEALFYHGYGRTEIDWRILTYYRYERNVQDIYEFCKQLLLSTEGDADRWQSLRYLKGIFEPGGTIEIAYTSDRT